MDVVIGLGLLLFFVSEIWIIIKATKTNNTWWILACIFVPLGKAFFTFFHWKSAWRQFAIGMAGISLLVACKGMLDFAMLKSATSEPLAVELEALESGTRPDNRHLALGKHLEVYSEAGYSYRPALEDASEKLTQNSIIKTLYIPVVSVTHPYARSSEKLVREYGSRRKVPKGKKPKLAHFTVLIRTNVFKPLKELQLVDVMSNQITGVTINGTSHCTDDDKKMITELFPDIALNSLIVLDPQRKVPSTIMTFLLLLGGWGVPCLVLFMLVKYRPGGPPREKEADK